MAFGGDFRPINGHEVHHFRDGLRGHRARDQDRGVREVELVRSILVAQWSDAESTSSTTVEQRSKHARRIKPWKTTPIDRAVSRDQRCRLEIADQAMITDRRVSIPGSSRPDWHRGISSRLRRDDDAR